MIAAELDLDRSCRPAPSKASSGWICLRRAGRRASRTWNATNSFRAAWSVIWRLCGVPEVVGGQVAVGLGGNQLAGEGWTLSSSSMMATSMPTTRGSAAAVTGLAGAGRCELGQGAAGTRSETATLAVAAGPRLPAASTARTDELDGRARCKFSGRAGASRLAARAGRPAGSARAAMRGRRACAKNPSVPAGPASPGVTHETRASPAGRSAVPGSTRRPLGAAGGRRSSGPSSIVK